MFLLLISLSLPFPTSLSLFLPLSLHPPALQWINIILSLVGKFGASAAFAIIYVYSCELFPTLLRNSLMGVTCLFARMGGMISPYIADLVSYSPLHR